MSIWLISAVHLQVPLWPAQCLQSHQIVLPRVPKQLGSHSLGKPDINLSDIMSSTKFQKQKTYIKLNSIEKDLRKMTRNPLNSGLRPTTVSQQHLTCFFVIVSVRVPRKQQTPEKQSLWDLKPCVHVDSTHIPCTSVCHYSSFVHVQGL